MGSNSKSQDKHITRYAPYVETAHGRFLNDIGNYRAQTVAYSESPYLVHADVSIQDAFLGVGYALSNFSALHDMFGKFMAGLDIDELFKDIFGSVLELPEIDNLTKAQLSLTDDKIVAGLLPQFALSMRSLNAVISSSFIIGKSLLEDRRTKLLNTINSDLKYLLIPTITKRWIDSLNFKKQIIFSHAFILKFYHLTKLDADRFDYKIAFRHTMWPFIVLDYERAALAALQGPTPRKKSEIKERSNVSKVLLVASYTVQGAVIGSYFGPWGTVIGAVIGFAIGLAIMLFE